MKYEDIQKVNQTLQLTPIHGKGYAQVSERIRAFRMLYPEGRIESEMVSDNCGRCIFRACVYSEDGRLLSTGTAYELENKSTINKTSYIENCETSAIGRALGFLGLGSETSIASAEEVSNAIQQQEDGSMEPIGKTRAKSLSKELEDHGIDEVFILDQYNVKTLADLKEAQHSHLITHIDQLKARQDREGKPAAGATPADRVSPPS